MLFNTLYFVSLPIPQVKPKNNLPEAISACLGQALISNPVLLSSTESGLQRALNIFAADVGKAQSEAQSATSATSAIAEVALRTKVFKICCALIALRFQIFVLVNSAVLYTDLNFVAFRSKY